MSADDDVDLPRLETREHRRLLFRSLKTTERFDVDWKISQPLAECSRVLVGENRRRHQHHHLPAGLHCLERGPNRDFRLAVAHISDQKAIHRSRTLHVAFYIGGGGALVGGVLESKAGFELTLPDCVRQVWRS